MTLGISCLKCMLLPIICEEALVSSVSVAVSGPDPSAATSVELSCKFEVTSKPSTPKSGRSDCFSRFDSTLAVVHDACKNRQHQPKEITFMPFKFITAETTLDSF